MNDHDETYAPADQPDANLPSFKPYWQALIFWALLMGAVIYGLTSCESVPQQQQPPKPCTPVTVYKGIPEVIEKMDSLEAVIALLHASHAHSDSAYRAEAKELQTQVRRHVDTNNDLKALYEAQVEDGEKYQSRLNDAVAIISKQEAALKHSYSVNDSLRRTRIQITKP